MEGKYTGTRFVRATGEIEAVVWYTEKETVNFKETKVEKQEIWRKICNKYK